MCVHVLSGLRSVFVDWTGAGLFLWRIKIGHEDSSIIPCGVSCRRRPGDLESVSQRSPEQEVGSVSCVLKTELCKEAGKMSHFGDGSSNAETFLKGFISVSLSGCIIRIIRNIIWTPLGMLLLV